MRQAYKKRRIFKPPMIQEFKPTGIPRKVLDTVTLNIDEFEAVRLADYKGLEHVHAAEKMGISRPTFTRLIDRAHRKIALALVEGKELIIRGGNVDFVYINQLCEECGNMQTTLAKNLIKDCPDCGSHKMRDLTSQYINPGEERMRLRKKGKNRV